MYIYMSLFVGYIFFNYILLAIICQRLIKELLISHISVKKQVLVQIVFKMFKFRTSRLSCLLNYDVMDEMYKMLALGTRSKASISFYCCLTGLFERREQGKYPNYNCMEPDLTKLPPRTEWSLSLV